MPAIPAELEYALKVNVDRLNPFEYGAMEADRYHLIVTLRNAWYGEREFWTKRNG